MLIWITENKLGTSENEMEKIKMEMDFFTYRDTITDGIYNENKKMFSKLFPTNRGIMWTGNNHNVSFAQNKSFSYSMTNSSV